MATHDSSVPMDAEKGAGHSPVATSNSRNTNTMKFASMLLRFLTFACTLSAFVVMITNKQSTYVAVAPGLSQKIWAKYHYSNAFMWFVVANGIAFGYALLTLLFTPFVKSPRVARILLLLDLIVAFIIMSGASAAAAIAYIGKHGLSEARWSPICGSFDRYCDHVSGALAASFLGWFFLYLAIIAAFHQKH